MEDISKKLARGIVGVGKFGMYRASQQPGNSGKSRHCSLKPEICRLGMQGGFPVAALRQNFFFKKAQSLFLRSSTDWMRPTHVTESNLLYFVC